MTLDIHSLRSEFSEPHSLLTTSDGITLFIREWKPKGTPRETTILILHGITAYSGPYDMIARPLASRGFAVYGLDLRGHGLSDGNRGDTPGRERYVRDLCEAIAYVKERHSRVVILGHSLGVLSSVMAMESCIDRFDGAILLSAARTTRPGIYPPIGAMQKLKIALSSIFSPRRQVMEYRREGMVGLDDPLFTFRYTLRFLRTTILSDFSFPTEMPFPVLVGIGEEDELFAVEAARELFEEIPSKTKEFLVAEAAKHAVFPDGSLNPIFEWVDTTFE
ncbi:MAG: alpha/beta hydrolase [Candidatus Thorarchaeota archaeon]|jgi:alpha-beta hydrolase superfamily lysophospholipase